jgi:4-alpha-glucanotransferase
MSRALRARARRLGVVTSYRGADGAVHAPSDETLGAIVDALDGGRPPIAAVDPVAVAWDGETARLRFAAGAHGGPDLSRTSVEVRSEDGSSTTVRVAACARPVVGGAEVDLSVPLPTGVHTAVVHGGPADGGAVTVLAAPRHVPGDARRRVGIFAPVTALHDDRGAADLGCLGRFACWAARQGVQVVATLPLLATFLDEPFDPSPYAPVSRRWWNDLFVDLDAVPELRDVARPPLPTGTHLDHRALMTDRRAVLETGAARMPSERAHAVAAFARRRPELAAYARFRAAKDAAAGRDPQTSERYHRYVQHLLDEQLRALAASVRARGQSLYLDLPVGTHPDGFDVAVEPGAFAAGVTTGAPPDAFFAAGQNWGFRPPHPAGMRRTGYRDLRASLARHLELCDVLRLDHVMGLQRLWWVPAGAAPAEGAYVRSPMEELFAVVAIEAARTGATVVGENLGTVARDVERARTAHRVRGMYVAQFAVDPTADPPLAAPGRRVVAAIDTHDTATFAGFWTARDVDDRARVVGPDPAGAERARAGRATARAALARFLLGRAGGDPGTSRVTQHAVLVALLAWLARGRAELVLVTLEDLWLEPDPQNLPGTGDAVHRNWSRRAARSIDELDGDAEVRAAMDAVRAAGRTEPLPC